MAIIVIPTTTLLIDAAFSQLPAQLLHGAFAPGASRCRTSFGMAICVLRSVILSASLLGLGRALGETIVVVMVTGNKAELPSRFLGPIRTLTANAALEIGYAGTVHGATLFFSILVLYLMTTGVALMVLSLDRKNKVQVDV